ncbi:MULTISPECIES: hypothetical protein [Amycolatopsis]|uniref:Uncharacterized protein n=1 Tax=Amycolatopsis albidoflavus TaxID=102226 RepID=A0ABW5HY51_9PSEU
MGRDWLAEERFRGAGVTGGESTIGPANPPSRLKNDTGPAIRPH